MVQKVLSVYTTACLQRGKVGLSNHWDFKGGWSWICNGSQMILVQFSRSQIPLVQASIVFLNALIKFDNSWFFSVRSWGHIYPPGVGNDCLKWLAVILPLFQSAPRDFRGAFWLRSFCPSKSGESKCPSWVILPLQTEGQNDSAGGAKWLNLRRGILEKGQNDWKSPQITIIMHTALVHNRAVFLGGGTIFLLGYPSTYTVTCSKACFFGISLVQGFVAVGWRKITETEKAAMTDQLSNTCWFHVHHKQYTLFEVYSSFAWSPSGSWAFLSDSRI